MIILLLCAKRFPDTQRTEKEEEEEEKNRFKNIYIKKIILYVSVGT